MSGELADKDAVLYHTGLSRAMLDGAAVALLPGDPGRVSGLAEALGSAVELAFHREYKSALAYVGKMPVLVMSTGMGGPSVAIGVEELARLGVRAFIRVGTTGAIQPDIVLGDLIINEGAVRLDGTSTHYAPLPYPAVADHGLTGALLEAADQLSIPHHLGIAASSDTFWPGQERYDSFTGYVPRRFQGSLAEWQALGVLNYEMETSALFVVARAMRLRAAAICGVVAQRGASEAVASQHIYQLAERRFQQVIKKTMEKISDEQYKI